MCGIAGIVTPVADNLSETLLHRMADAIRYRGPDDSDIWIDKSAGIGLAHRRLSIVDLSPAGRQPMCSQSGRYLIVFNGEIYNHRELRKSLDAAFGNIKWRGHSDTESLLSGFDAWGIAETIHRCVGMFAFAVWDKADRVLTLGRDRLGEKPLYYGWQEKTFLFGSELESLKAHPAFSPVVDRNALALLMRHNAIPAPYSIYHGIRKLPQGTLLSLFPKHLSRQEEAEPVPYWDACKVIEKGIATPFPGSEQDAADELERLLCSSIAQQMVADVPLGAFLSGGIDSSTIAALMQAQSNRPVRTFSIGFEEEDYNEAAHAEAVARHLGTMHESHYVTPQEALDIIPRLPSIYSEPLADASQIPTFLVCELARRHVTVALSGDGGDELFGGYNRYVLADYLWKKFGGLPFILRSSAGKMISAISPARWDTLLTPLQFALPKSLRFVNMGDKLHKGASVLAAETWIDVYQRPNSYWRSPEALVPGAREPLTILTDDAHQPKTDHAIHRMMALDLLNYLPDDILAKMDRAAMAVSLETRVPFLDHRVVEFAWRLPLNLKIKNGVGKWLLRKVLYKYVPQALVERPKMGFGVPLEYWLRNQLRDWAEALLNETRLRHEGFFNSKMVREKWNEHLSGRKNWQYLLWSVLVFQAWLEAAKSRSL